MTAPKPAGDAWPPLPFAETTAWSASHVGRRLALEAAQAAEPLPAGVPFTGQPFCLGYDGSTAAPEAWCTLAAGHTGPCRFTRRLP